MALFEAATDAVRAGTELVEAIAKEGGFSIRVAMATGDVEVIDGDAFGDAVNTASRILAKTPDAEVRFSKTTRLRMNQSEIAWERVGLFFPQRHRSRGGGVSVCSAFQILVAVAIGSGFKVGSIDSSEKGRTASKSTSQAHDFVGRVRPR